MGTIVKHELLDNFKSFHFFMLIIFSAMLFSLNGFMYTERIQKSIEEYASNISDPQNRSTVATKITRKPGLLMFISEGGDKYRAKQYQLYPGGTVQPSPGSVNFNYKMPDSMELDWSFIIKVIFSLYAILIAFESVSGERERGTLGLIFSNSVNRVRYILQKYFAISIIVFIPLLIGMLISLIIVVHSIPQVYSPDTFLSILLFLAAAFVYLSIFILLSLIVSSLVYRSFMVLLILLSMWLLFFVIPDVSILVSSKMMLSSSEYRVVHTITDKNFYTSGLSGLSQRIEKGELTSEEDVENEGRKIIYQLENRLKQYDDNYVNSFSRRERYARIISRLSPMSLFQYTAESIATTGPYSVDAFLRDANAFSTVYDDYIIAKTGTLIRPLVYSFGMSYTWSVRFKDRMIRLSVPRPEIYKGNMPDFPVFAQGSIPIGQKIKSGLGDFIGILVWNGILSMLLFVVIQKIDVRYRQ